VPLGLIQLVAQVWPSQWAGQNQLRGPSPMGWQLTCEIGERLHGARAVAPVHCQQASGIGSGARGQEGHWCLGGTDLGRVIEEEAHWSGVLHGGAA
jgi:hypothetical protein